MIKVKKIQEIINSMNPEANFILTVNGFKEDDFEINYGGSEGVTPKNAEFVSLNIHATNETKPSLN